MKMALILLMTTAGVLRAEDPQFVTLMKGMDAAFGVLRQPEFMSDKRAARSAERLGSSYEDLIEFWRQQKAIKAVTISETGKATAVQLAEAVHAGNAEKAAALVKAMGETCQSCHEAYREKQPDGKYRMKIEDTSRRTTPRTP